MDKTLVTLKLWQETKIMILAIAQRKNLKMVQVIHLAIQAYADHENVNLDK